MIANLLKLFKDPKAKKLKSYKAQKTPGTFVTLGPSKVAFVMGTNYMGIGSFGSKMKNFAMKQILKKFK
jgi:hypothetical protein